jgi:hypothetical protein
MQTTVATPPAPPAPVFTPQQVAEMKQLTRAAQELQQATAALQPSTVIGVPQTPAELRALKTRRSEISSQLENVAARRKTLANQIEQARIPAVQDGMVDRLKVMDQRIVSLETDLAETGRLLQLAPQSAYAGSETRIATTIGGGSGGSTGGGNNYRSGIDEDIAIPLGALFILAVLMPLAITAARIWWRRATGTLPARQHKAENDRLDRIEGAVETIALEMERVSEGQRFMTRMLTEGRGEQPVFGSAARGEALPIARGQHES